MSNKNLHSAKAIKNDEFYTQYDDIAKEIKYYKEALKGKTVFCNCDDPLKSNFTKYFFLNFRHFGLKRLISTFYDINGGKAFVFDYDGKDMDNDGVITEFDIELICQTGVCQTILVDDEGYNSENKEECWKNGIYGSGDFRSKNVISYLKESDIVVTNPPFSLFREYVAQLMEYGKKFIIIGNTNVATYKEIFPLIKENKLWIGVTNYNVGMYFYLPDSYTEYKEIKDGKKIGRVSTSCWWTNIDNKRRNEIIDLYKKYSPDEYPKYDNYDAIEVSNYQDIPVDYDGVMGVPITFLGHYNPAQFEIIKFRKGNDEKDLSINGVCPYFRILIKKIQ